MSGLSIPVDLSSLNDPTAAAIALAVRESYDIIPSSVSVDLTSIATTNVVSVTETGILLGIAAYVQDLAVTVSPIVTLGLTVDGGSRRSIPVYSNGVLWHSTGVGGWKSEAGTMGTSSDDNFKIPMGGSRYLTSLLVDVDVTDGAGVGVLVVQVLRGKAL